MDTLGIFIRSKLLCILGFMLLLVEQSTEFLHPPATRKKACRQNTCRQRRGWGLMGLYLCSATWRSSLSPRIWGSLTHDILGFRAGSAFLIIVLDLLL